MNKFGRKLILIALVGCLPACVALDSGPDPALIGSCKATVDDAAKSLKQAEQLGYTMTSAYKQSYKLVTQAKVHMKFEKYSYCLRKASRAQQYLNQLLVTGKDL